MDNATATLDEWANNIKTLAGLLFSPKEIAVMLGNVQDKSQFVFNCMHNESSMEYQAYQSGKLEQEMLIRKSVLTLAKQGSSPAQTLAVKLLQELNLKELERE